MAIEDVGEVLDVAGLVFDAAGELLAEGVKEVAGIDVAIVDPISSEARRKKVDRMGEAGDPVRVRESGLAGAMAPEFVGEGFVVRREHAGAGPGAGGAVVGRPGSRIVEADAVAAGDQFEGGGEADQAGAEDRNH